MEAMETMLSACPERAIDGQHIWIDSKIGLGHQHFWITPEEQGERQPLVDQATGCAITADVRLDNREELSAQLGLASREAQRMSDAELILQAYLRWGDECVERLLGDFAFAIWDGQRGCLFCARDPLGARSIAYYEDQEVAIVATDIEAILAHPSVTPKINETKIADFLAGVYHYPDESCYVGVRYCLAGQCLSFSAAGSRSWKYWELKPDQPIRYRYDHEYVEHFEALLADAVRCHMRAVGPVGISLSGGLDSPTLAAIATELLPASPARQEHLHSFSYVFDELVDCDEREYIQPVVACLGLDSTCVVSDDKWTLKDLPDWPVDRATVFSDSFLWLLEGVMAAAEHKGCHVLLAGHYGDSLFTGSRFWAVDLLRDKRYAELVATLAAHRTGISWRSHILDAGLRHALPLPVRNAYRRLRPHLHLQYHDVLNPDFAARTAIGDRSRDPERYLRGRLGTRTWSRLRSLTINLTTDRLVEIQKYYNRHGLELSNPYLDRRLAEFVLNVPAYLLGGPGRNRWLLRRVARRRLPPTVASRKSKTSFESLHRKGMRMEDERIQQLVQDALVVEFGYVRAEWIESQYSHEEGWRDFTTSNEAWLCICLELWLRKVSAVGVAL